MKTIGVIRPSSRAVAQSIERVRPAFLSRRPFGAFPEALWGQTTTLSWQVIQPGGYEYERSINSTSKKLLPIFDWNFSMSFERNLGSSITMFPLTS